MSKLHSIFNEYNKDDYPVLTHGLHPYPAKFPPHIPGLLLDNYGTKGDLVLDPFMGSGTTVVEANFLGYNAIGNDTNPLSDWLVKTKTTKLTDKDLSLLDEFKFDLERYYLERKEVPRPEWRNIDHWFKPHILYELSLIKWLIRQEKYIHLEWYLSILLSSIVVLASNQDNDIRYTRHEKTANDKEGYVINNYFRRLKQYTKINQKLPKTYDNYKVYTENALELKSVKDNSIDMIITSPPYANTNDYFLNHRLRLLLLDLDYDYYRTNEIGSHAQFSSKKHDISQWNFDLLTMMKNFNRMLKTDKDAFIVIGDTVWRRDLYKMNDIIIGACKESGFEFQDIHSYNLNSISRSFNPKFADKNHVKEEHIIHIKKTKDRGFN